jgi:hypothetical protein
MSQKVTLEIEVDWLLELKQRLEDAARPKVVFSEDIVQMSQDAIRLSTLSAQIALNNVNDVLRSHGHR